MSDAERARWRDFAATLERYAEGQDKTTDAGMAVAVAYLGVAQAARAVADGTP